VFKKLGKDPHEDLHRFDDVPDQIQISIKIESRIRIIIDTMPIHNTAIPVPYLPKIQGKIVLPNHGCGSGGLLAL
jgi:hypothetical protein